MESRQYKAKGIAMITDKIEMTIPGELPDLNTIIAESKKGNRNWQPYNHMKKRAYGEDSLDSQVKESEV